MMSRAKESASRYFFLLVGFLCTIGFAPLGARGQVYLYNQANFATASQPQAVAVADFNGDGKPDLAVAATAQPAGCCFTPGPGVVSILLAQPDGSFGPKADYPVGVGPSGLSAADFTGDGKLDLAVVNTGGATVSILTGMGDGTFQPDAEFPVGANPSGIVASDFNGDGKMDLAVLNRGAVFPAQGSVSILLGKGDGTFQPQVQVSVGGNPAALASGDFDGDGKLDLVVSNTADNTVSVLLSRGNGTFARLDSSAGSSPNALAVADFNGDGKLDLVASSGFGGFATLILGNGDGTFQTPATLSNVIGNSSVMLASDVNRDGKTDLLTTFFSFPGGVSVFLGNGDGTFQTPPKQAGTGSGTGPMALADLNGDGLLDLAVPISNANVVTISLGNGDGSFGSEIDIALPSSILSAQALAVADFNKDGKLDAAIAYGPFSGVPGVAVSLGQGDRTFSAFSNFAVASSITPTSALVGDFNGDGVEDLAVGGAVCCSFPPQGTVSVLLGNGNGTFRANIDTTLPSGADGSNSVAADFNGDGKTDLAMTSNNFSTFPATSSVVILLSNGSGTFNPPSSISVAPSAGTLLTGDFNGDGKPDIAAISGNLGVISTFLGKGDGTFAPGSAISIPPSLSTMTLGDFNADGKTDIAAVTTNGIFVLPGNGDGTFRAAINTVGLFSAISLRAGDFNGDGRLDLAMNSNLGLLVLLGKGDGSFDPKTRTLNTTLGAASVSAADFNKDSTADLAFVGNANFCCSTPTLSVMFSGPEGSFFPSALAFPPQVFDSASSALPLTVTNIGNAAMIVSGITRTGDFAETDDCTAVPLAPQAWCNVNVTFTPTVSGPRTGTLRITDNAQGSPHMVALSGTGQDFSVAVAAGTPASNTVTAGTGASYTIAVSPQGGFNQTVSLSCTGAPAKATCSVSPNPLALDGTNAATATVSVSTTASTLAPPAPRGNPLRPLPVGWPAGLWLGMLGLFGLAAKAARRNQVFTQGRVRIALLLPLAALFLGITTWVSCGGGGGGVAHTPGTPAGTYTLTITGTSGSLSHSTTLTLTVR